MVSTFKKCLFKKLVHFVCVVKKKFLSVLPHTFLNTIAHQSIYMTLLSSFARSFRILILSSKAITTYSNLLLSVNLIIMRSSPSTTQVMKMLNSFESKMKQCTGKLGRHCSFHSVSVNLQPNSFSNSCIVAFIFFM